MDNSDLVVASPSAQLSANLGDEFVVLNPADETYYGMAGVGGRIWELIQLPRTIGELVATIAREYEVDPDICAADTVTFLDELSSRSFVVITSNG